MRITGGRARGIPLLAPKGDLVRPATDGMRQSVFSSLGERVVGARFLDLFAGSGAYGLEAVSRGAAGGVFVEQNARAVACLRQNIMAVCKSLVRDPGDLLVMQADVSTLALGAGGEAPFAGAAAGAPARRVVGEPPDLVFVDPPYDVIDEIAAPLFARLDVLLALEPDALVVFELPGERELRPDGWQLLKRLGKGARQPTVAFFRRVRNRV
jgi:16S rRNA (guanine966-N2)-methyltransferase